MTEIQAADGTILELPRDMPADQAAAIRDKYNARLSKSSAPAVAAPAAAPASAQGDTPTPPVVGYAKAAGSGAAKGLIAGTAGLPGDLEALLKPPPASINSETGQPYPQDTMVPTTQALAKALGLHEPQTTGEKYADSAGAGATSLLFPGKGGPLARLIIGALSGAAGEAGQQFGDPVGLGAVGRVAGSAAGMLPGAGALKTPGATKAAQGAIQALEKGLGPAALNDAGATANQAAQALGTPVSLSQGFAERNPLTDLVEEILSSPKGQDLHTALLGQRRAVDEKSTDLMAQLAAAKGVQQAQPGASAALLSPSPSNQANISNLKSQLQDVLDASLVTDRHQNVGMQGQGEQAANNPISAALRVVNPLGWIRTWAEAGPIGGMFQSSAYNKLSKALLSPNAADELRKIGEFSPSGNTVQKLLEAILGIERQHASEDRSAP